MAGFQMSDLRLLLDVVSFVSQGIQYGCIANLESMASQTCRIAEIQSKVSSKNDLEKSSTIVGSSGLDSA